MLSEGGGGERRRCKDRTTKFEDRGKKQVGTGRDEL